MLRELTSFFCDKRSVVHCLGVNAMCLTFASQSKILTGNHIKSAGTCKQCFLKQALAFTTFNRARISSLRHLIYPKSNVSLNFSN